VETLLGLWAQSDAVGRLVALCLLGMSVLSWVLIVWKSWRLRGALDGLRAALQLLWQSPSWSLAQQRLSGHSAGAWVLPLVQAAHTPSPAADSLAAQVDPQAQHTRVLRDALGRVQQHLHYGQVVLATIGATAPFVGLLGTVWGIYHALIAAVLGYNALVRAHRLIHAELDAFAHDLHAYLATGVRLDAPVVPAEASTASR